MKRRIQDMVIMSDVDGTLITRDHKRSARNVEALNRFIAKGGRFGLSTGRVPIQLKELLGHLPINFPCVMYNGGMIYDYNTGKILKDWVLPEQARPYFRMVEEAVPTCEALVVSDNYYIIREDTTLKDQQNDKGRRYAFCPDLDKIPLPWRKGLFFIDESQFDAFYEHVNNGNYPGVRFVATNYRLQEMLPEGCSKATALTELVKMENVPLQNLVCIGDFYNDMEMIKLAGIGVTLKDSPQDLKDAADLVVGTCQDGALADLVEYLESICED
ncbi:Cof-type HAD-IIB family hydrolase [Oscillospiraceae bacterium MB08-C2-2]|nr:Cof-type HAD-IIB family hydrolase [Oscillospiraceae bacterium MB08-C2-2]